jgi:hypothetical protein
MSSKDLHSLWGGRGGRREDGMGWDRIAEEGEGNGNGDDENEKENGERKVTAIKMKD